MKDSAPPSRYPQNVDTQENGQSRDEYSCRDSLHRRPRYLPVDASLDSHQRSGSPPNSAYFRSQQVLADHREIESPFSAARPVCAIPIGRQLVLYELAPPSAGSALVYRNVSSSSKCFGRLKRDWKELMRLLGTEPRYELSKLPTSVNPGSSLSDICKTVMRCTYLAPGFNFPGGGDFRTDRVALDYIRIRQRR